MRLLLYINKTWVEPDLDRGNENLISLNFNFESFENPTNYISEYSYDCNIPKTEKNNKLFEFIFRLDSTKVYNTPIPYIYISDGDTISKGSCYVKEMNQDDYVISLNGTLSTVFNVLLNSGWYNSNGNENYTLLDEPFKGILLNPQNIIKSYEKDEMDWDILTGASNSNKYVNTIGFMPTNHTEHKNFSNGKWLLLNNFYNVGEYPNSSNNNTIGETTEQEMGEFRCTQLRPYIYVKRLWDIYQKECKKVTGYEMVLDKRWFNESYPYLKQLVYTLPKLNTESSADSNQYIGDKITITIKKGNFSQWFGLNRTITSPYRVTANQSNMARFEWSIPVDFISVGEWTANYIVFDPTQYIITTITIKNNSQTYITKKIVYVPLTSLKKDNGDYVIGNLSENMINQIKSVTGASEVRQYRYGINNSYNNSIQRTYHNFGYITGGFNVSNCTNAYMEIKMQVGTYYTRSNPIVRIVKNGDNYTLTNIEKYGWEQGKFDSTPIIDSTLIYNNGTGSEITMARLFINQSPFVVLLKYSKMLGLIWVVDDYKEKITVIRRADYFYDCFNKDLSSKNPPVYPYKGFYDITHLTDMKSYTITPISWEEHDLIFNYETGDENYGEPYEKKFNITYGSVIVHTENKVNNDSKKLLGSTEYNKINPPIVSSEWIQDISAKRANRIGKFQDDPYLNDIENTFCFRLKNSNYSTATRYNNYKIENGNAYVTISGDSTTEIENQEYCWHSSTLTTDVKTFIRPVFSAYNGEGYSILFAQPKEVYVNEIPVTDDYLFNVEWRDYFSEIYNINNKTISCYAKIDGQLYNRLKILPFVILGNIGYMVMSIEDWSDENDLTKITLKQINNVQQLYAKKNI